MSNPIELNAVVKSQKALGELWIDDGESISSADKSAEVRGALTDGVLVTFELNSNSLLIKCHLTGEFWTKTGSVLKLYTRIVHFNCTYKNCKNHKIDKNHEKIKSQKLNFWKFEIEIRKWSKAWNWTVQFIKNQNYFSIRLFYCRSTPRLIRKVFKLMPSSDWLLKGLSDWLSNQH